MLASAPNARVAARTTIGIRPRRAGRVSLGSGTRAKRTGGGFAVSEREPAAGA